MDEANLIFRDSLTGWDAIWQDGRIDYGEFAAMMRKGERGIGSRTIRGNLNFNLGDAFGVKDATEWDLLC